MRSIANPDKIVVKAKIIEAYPGAKFKIGLEKGHEIIGYTSGKMHRYNIRVLPGDHVKLELTPYDLERGRIIFRNRRGEI